MSDNLEGTIFETSPTVSLGTLYYISHKKAMLQPFICCKYQDI